MSFHFYRIDSLADEKRLLKNKLNREKQIRQHREKNRRLKSAKSREYSTIFEPVTKSLDDLKDIHKTAAAAVSSQTGDLMKEDDLIDEPIHDLGLSPLLAPDRKPGALYLQALDSIPIKSLDDGVFGLNIHTQSIGNNNFYVDNNTLIVENKDDGTIQTFDINDCFMAIASREKTTRSWFEFQKRKEKGRAQAVSGYCQIIESDS